LAEDGTWASKASLVDDHVKNNEFEGAIWAYIEVDISAFLGKTEKASVTLPKLLITRIDALVKAGKVKSRSTFLAESALKALNSSS
jgi:hypothetical protein